MSKTEIVARRLAKVAYKAMHCQRPTALETSQINAWVENNWRQYAEQARDLIAAIDW